MYCRDYYILDLFHQDFEVRFQRCDCDSFKSDYYRSIRYYFYATCVAGTAGIINVFNAIVMRCRAKPGAVSPGH